MKGERAMVRSINFPTQSLGNTVSGVDSASNPEALKGKLGGLQQDYDATQSQISNLRTQESSSSKPATDSQTQGADFNKTSAQESSNDDKELTKAHIEQLVNLMNNIQEMMKEITAKLLQQDDKENAQELQATTV